MEDFLVRTKLLISNEQVNKIKNAKVIVFGVGGVGGFCVESLVRSGISDITVVDNDTINISNINRQLIALHSTIGLNKVDVISDRIKDINPMCNVTKYNIFYNKDTYHLIDLTKYDYIIDCIDTISAKIEIAKVAYFNDIKLISSMGTGNRLDPSTFSIMDVFKTNYDPVAKVMRYELKKRNIKKLKVLCSNSQSIKRKEDPNLDIRTPGSISFVPSVAGLLITSHVINEIINN